MPGNPLNFQQSLFWGVLILVLDGYELAVVGAALPSIMKDMRVDATGAGIMAGSALFGMICLAPSSSGRWPTALADR